MRAARERRVLVITSLLLAFACRDTGRVDAATLEHTPSGVRLHVVILGAPADPRVAPVREAVAHWNGELARLGRRVRLDSGTVRPRAVSDAVLGAASGEAWLGFGPGTYRLRQGLSGAPGDVVIALSDTALVSYGLPWRAGVPGVVVLRRADVWPLSQPNTLRNVAAHEIGHALGLVHNGDSTTLMCGRPASCRPTAFTWERARFFPLTPTEDDRIRERWP